MDIAITADDSMAPASLYRWLSEDNDVVRVADLSMGSTGQGGQMGVLDVVNVSLTNAIAFSAVVMGYISWRKARDETADVTFTVNGMSVTVRNASPETVQRLLALAEQPAATSE